MNLQKNRQLINFMLLHSYSLTNSGLMFGKSGIALCLFEAARFFEYEKLEEYGLELLQEAIAWETSDYSFQNGKAGIICVAEYLIKNEFIDADLRELCGEEINEIIYYIKRLEKKQANISDCIGFLAFLFMIERQISQSDFDDIYQLLVSILNDYFVEFPASAFHYKLFYIYSSIILGFGNAIEGKKKYCLTQIIDSIINKSNEMSMDCVCDNLSYAVNLYIYGKKYKHLKAIYIGERALEIITDNIIKETLNLKQLMEFPLILKQLSSYEKNIDSLYNMCCTLGNSYFYMNGDSVRTSRTNLQLNELMSFEAGVPKFIWIACLKNIEEWDFDKKILLLF